MKLGQLQALLDEKEEEARQAKEASLNLTRKLNDALSSKVAELQGSGLNSLAACVIF